MRSIKKDYKGMPPIGFGNRNRSREDMIKGTLALLRDLGPSSITEILYTQEVSSIQVTDFIQFMHDNDLVITMKADDEFRNMLQMPRTVRDIVMITAKGERYLKILETLDTMLTRRPLSQNAT